MSRPPVDLSGAILVSEGSTHLYTFTVTDPGDDDFTIDDDYPTCGDFGVVVDDSLEVTAAGGTFECRFPDGPHVTSVAFKVTDSDVASDIASEDVLTVEDREPAADDHVGHGGSEPGRRGALTTVTVLATDPAGADDPLTYEFDCDGNGDVRAAQASNTFDCTLR